tara:strand:- start:79 stop:600 length:522 start_codon:yes stop_codon:yes gene_type:complete
MAAFRFELTEEENERLANLAKCQGVSKAKILRWLISKLPGDDENGTGEKEETKGGEKRRIQIRVSNEAYQAIQEKAALGKYQTPSAWVKKLVEANVKQAAILATDEKRLLSRYINELVMIGNNINQIAHAANIDPRNTKQLASLNLEEMATVVREAEAAAEAWKNATKKRWRI